MKKIEEILKNRKNVSFFREDKIPEKCQHLVTIYNKDFLKTIGEIVTTNLPQSFLKIGYK